MQVVLKSPADCTEQLLRKFTKFVEEGGEVTSIGLEERINNAEKLIFVMDWGRLIAIGAIKNANQNYRESVFEKAGALDQASNFQYEFGWVYVPVEFRNRGLGRTVVQAATDYALTAGIRMFATCRENNHVIRALNDACGLTQLGHAYESKHGDYSLVLYINATL